MAGSRDTTGLYVLALGDGEPDLPGGDSVLDETIAKAVELEELTVSRLATELGLSPQAVDNRLTAFVRAGALSRQRTATRMEARADSRTASPGCSSPPRV